MHIYKFKLKGIIEYKGSAVASINERLEKCGFKEPISLVTKEPVDIGTFQLTNESPLSKVELELFRRLAHRSAKKNFKVKDMNITGLKTVYVGHTIE